MTPAMAVVLISKCDIAFLAGLRHRRRILFDLRLRHVAHVLLAAPRLVP
jgi:hypothetical protein